MYSAIYSMYKYYEQTLTRQTCWTRVTKQPKTADESDFGKKKLQRSKICTQVPRTEHYTISRLLYTQYCII